MKGKHMFLHLGALLSLGFVLTYSVYPQRVYNEERDTTAQEAAKLAEEIINKSTFENQLKNLETFARRDAELHFRRARRQMELEIRDFRTWRSVDEFVDGVEGVLSAENFITSEEARIINEDLEKDCKERTTELGKAICAAKAEFAKLNQAVIDSEKQGKALEKELKTRLEDIGEIESLIGQASTFLESRLSEKNKATVDGLTGVFTNMAKSYVNFTNKLAVINNEPADQLKLILQRVAVQTLQLEADHWKTIGEIKLRRGEEQKDLKRLTNQFDNRLTKIAKYSPCWDAGAQNQTDTQRLENLKNERVEVTFSKVRAMSADCLWEEKPTEKGIVAAFLVETLYVATSLAARGETPMKLAQLRLAQEEHRYSIRQSALIARSYELTISSGTKRLARYYAGGIKPEKIAQLIQSAATVAVPAVIAGK